jgi:hypothetical protein
VPKDMPSPASTSHSGGGSTGSGAESTSAPAETAVAPEVTSTPHVRVIPAPTRPTSQALSWLPSTSPMELAPNSHA